MIKKRPLYQKSALPRRVCLTTVYFLRPRSRTPITSLHDEAPDRRQAEVIGMMDPLDNPKGIEA